MSRSLLCSAFAALVLAPLLAGSTFAAGPGNAYNQAYTYPQTPNGVPPDGVPYNYNYSPGYANIRPALYPCPKPDIPLEVGRTLITNPALAPHEMLYPHCYRALYPPYYYKNTCGLACLPFVPKPCLCGTEVTVQYKSHLGCFGRFYPPISCRSYPNSVWHSTYTR